MKIDSKTLSRVWFVAELLKDSFSSLPQARLFSPTGESLINQSFNNSTVGVKLENGKLKTFLHFAYRPQTDMGLRIVLKNRFETVFLANPPNRSGRIN